MNAYRGLKREESKKTPKFDKATFYKDATPERLARALLRPKWRDAQIPPPPMTERVKDERRAPRKSRETKPAEVV